MILMRGSYEQKGGWVGVGLGGLDIIVICNENKI